MDKNRILAILRSHAPELQAAGLAHLRLFGSVARGEATPQSDIDLIADFALDEPPPKILSSPQPPLNSKKNRQHWRFLPKILCACISSNSLQLK